MNSNRRVRLGGLAALVGLALAACVSGQQQSTIAALEVGLATAETAAAQYTRLPSCQPPGLGGSPAPVTPAVCADPAVVQKMRDADNAAYSTIKAAEAQASTGASVSLTAASSALAAFQAYVTIYARPAPPAQSKGN